MNARTYFTILIVLLFLGAGWQGFNHPNQEILIKCGNEDFKSPETQNILSSIERRLQHVGVKNIQILWNNDGSLKIRYHCTIGVNSIRELILKVPPHRGKAEYQGNLPDYLKTKRDNNYFFSVFEIQKITKTNSDFDDCILSELKWHGERFSNPKNYTSNYISEAINKRENPSKISCNTFTWLSSNTLKAIPEIRAGPSVDLSTKPILESI